MAPPLLGIIKPGIDCCLRLAEVEVCYCLRMDKHVRDLSRDLSKLKSQKKEAVGKMEDAKKRGDVLTEQAQGWLERVKKEEEAALSIQDGHAGLSTCMCFAPNAYSAAVIGRRAVELLPVLNNLFTELSTMTLTTRPPTPAVILIRTANATGIDSAQICRVLGYLQDDGVGVVGICGPGGVGKTALLVCINNHFYTESIPPPAPPIEAPPPPPPADVDGEGDHLRFDYVICLTLLSDFTEDSLRRDIARRLELTVQGDDADSSTDAQVISDFLGGVSFLLLLDGLQKPVNLSHIGIPQAQPSGIHRHKVMFTTRSRSVCGHMDAEATIRMQCLSPTNALALFQKKAKMSASDAAGPLRRLIEKVAGECSGLPRAIVDVGNAMSQTRSFQDWERAWTKLQQSNIQAILSTQFNPSNYLIYGYSSNPGDNAAINKCFLSCSLWPGNSSINSEELVLSWIGLGLIDDLHCRDVSAACDAGREIVKKLKDDCLLEPGESDQSQVRMLNPIRWMALNNVSSERSTTQNRWIVWSGIELTRAPQEEKQWESAELVALVRSGVEELLPLSATCPKLRTLMLGGNPALKAVPPSFLRFMSNLTYLDLSETGLEEVPPDIGTLVELKYLNLSCTYIRVLPKVIGRLVKLRYLLLYGTLYLKKIHRGALSILPKLRLLDLTESGYAYHWAERDANNAGGGSIGELRNIKSFRGLGLTIASLSRMDQIHSLPSAPIWRMSIMNLEGLDFGALQLLSPDFLGKPNIRDNLTEFTMKHSSSLNVLDMGAGECGSGGSMPKLEILRLLSLSSLESISWSIKAALGASPFPSLRHLTISYCDRLREASWVSELPCLKHLELSHCSQMEAVLVVPTDGDALDCLRMLVLQGLPQLKSVCNQRLGFASLECLRVSGCPHLDKLLFRVEMSGAGKMQTIEGEKSWWDNLQWAPQESCIKASLQTVFVCIPPVPPPLPPPHRPLPYRTGARERQAGPPQPVGIRKIMALLTSFCCALLFLVGIARLKLLLFLQSLLFAWSS